MRQDVREAVYMAKIKGDKVNFAAMARQFNCDYRTVKRYYYQRDGTSGKRKPRVISKKTDGYEEIIRKKFIEDKAPSIAIYEVLKNKYGYKGSYSTIKKYTQTLKEECITEATVRFETSPGLQCQIDWKEELTLVNQHGDSVTVNIFLAILGYSRLKYIELTTDKTQPTLFKCLSNTFRFFGGTPQELLFDNMKTVVDQSRTQYQEPVYNDTFYQFSKDAGFIPKSCIAYRPRTKGKVEVVAKLMNRLKAYNNEFDSIEDLADIVSQLNEEINNEIQQTTLEKPIERFNKEKEYLNPEPRSEILEAYYSPLPIVRKVPKDCLIMYKNHRYSVPAKYVGKQVTLTESDNCLLIHYNQQFVTSHPITDKLITYSECDYRELLSRTFSVPETIERICEENLTLFDKLT